MLWKAIDLRYRIIFAAFITVFIGGFIGALISELKTVVNFFSFPLVYFSTTFHPVEETADFWKIGYAGICILIYSAIIIFPFTCITVVRQINAENKNNNRDNLQIELYTKEIATTLESLDRPNLSSQEQEEVLEAFLRTISNKIIDSFPGTSMDTVRYAFLLSHPNTSNKEYSTVKLGRNGSLSDDDHKVIEWILTNKDDDFYINGDIKNEVTEVSVGYDMGTVGLVRNSGSDFRFGFVIYFPNSDAFKKPKIVDHFIVNSSAIRVIAYMDTLWSSMVQYSYTVTRGGER